jgi:peptidyl-prolyl cis-trans isomerase SurA
MGFVILAMAFWFRLLRLQLVSSLLAVSFLLIPGGSRGEILERIVAVVNNDVITLSELEEAGKRMFEQVKESSLPSEREEKLRKAREAVLDQLIENKLLEQEIKNKKIEVTERDIDAALEQIKQQNQISEDEMKAVLAKDGITLSAYRRRLQDDIGKMRLINREIKSKIVLKEEEVRKNYQDNLTRFTDPAEVKIQQIFFGFPQWATQEQVASIRKDALAILERAHRGEDFADLARKYSQGAKAREGGVLGFFKHKELRRELEEAAFKLQTGEVSGLIKTPEGLHILRVLERKGGEPKPFAEVQSRLRDEMMQAESERQFQEWMKALKAKAYIEIRL